MIMKYFFVTLFIFYSIYSKAQNLQTFTDSIPTLSSPRSSDLNGDGVMDIVIGGGTDSVFSNNGIMAYNGVDGSLLWIRPSRDEVFGSAIFQDITADGIDDSKGLQVFYFEGRKIVRYMSFLDTIVMMSAANRPPD